MFSSVLGFSAISSSTARVTCASVSSENRAKRDTLHEAASYHRHTDISEKTQTAGLTKRSNAR